MSLPKGCSVVLLVLVIITTFLPAAFSIRCYYGYDLSEGESPQQKTLCEATIVSCMKTVNEDLERFSYGCGTREARDACERAETPRGDVERCYCSEDLCNGADAAARGKSLFVVMAAVAAALRFLQ